MINLLPPEIKKEVSYARRNKRLIAWVVILAVFMLVLIIITGLGRFYVEKNASDLNRLVDISNQRIVEQDLVEFQKKSEQFSNDLNTAVKLLKEQLLFSKIIRTVGSVLPDGVVLTNLNYSSEDEVLSLNVEGGSQRDISVAFTNINASDAVGNTLFVEADLVKVECTIEENPTCTGNIVVLLDKNSSFYLLQNAIESLEQNP